MSEEEQKPELKITKAGALRWPQFSRGTMITLKALMASFIIAAVGLSGYQFLSGPMFVINDVEIGLDENAAHPYIFPKIKRTLDTKLKALAGRSIWQVDLENLLKQIEGDQRIKEAKITRVLPNKIKIDVSPYTSIANIMGDSSDKLYPVARDGSVLPAVPPLEAPDSPILRGQKFLQNNELRKTAMDMLLALPEKGPLSISRVSEIEFNKKKGFSIIIAPSGFEVWLGFDDFKTRAHQAQRVIEYVQREGLTGRIIDARFAKKVVVKLRNEP